jgi:hypothetical protein
MLTTSKRTRTTSGRPAQATQTEARSRRLARMATRCHRHDWGGTVHESITPAPRRLSGIPVARKSFRLPRNLFATPEQQRRLQSSPFAGLQTNAEISPAKNLHQQCAALRVCTRVLECQVSADSSETSPGYCRLCTNDEVHSRPVSHTPFIILVGGSLLNLSCPPVTKRLARQRSRVLCQCKSC